MEVSLINRKQILSAEKYRTDTVERRAIFIMRFVTAYRFRLLPRRFTVEVFTGVKRTKVDVQKERMGTLCLKKERRN